MPLVEAPFRLAFRREGRWWNAYLAKRDTMDGALQLGSMLITLAENCPPAKEAFMTAMQEALAGAAKGALGADLLWPSPPRPAPESERSGDA